MQSKHHRLLHQHNVKQGLTRKTEHTDGQPYQISDDNQWTSLQGDACLKADCKAETSQPVKYQGGSMQLTCKIGQEPEQLQSLLMACFDKTVHSWELLGSCSKLCIICRFYHMLPQLT